MKRIPEFDPRWAWDRRPAFTTSTELDGFVGAGMKKEALALARHLLKAPVVAAPEFADAVQAILILADKVKPLKGLIEAAYERVPKRKRGSVRFWLMSVRDACHDHVGVLRLISGRFTGKLALQETVWAMKAAFASGSTRLIRLLAPRLPRLISRVDDPLTRAQLLLCLAQFYAREGKWADAIVTAEPAQECAILLRNAVGAIVEIHAARALQTVRRGFEKIEAFSKHFDPKTELTLPGNTRTILNQTEKAFLKLQRILERIVPEERRYELEIV
jgi:hypothetical protein